MFVLAKKYRAAAFALLFFLINIAITFQPIVGITPSIMNDRYTYLASLGIFFLFALLFRQAQNRWVLLQNRDTGSSSWFVWACLAAARFQRSKVWQDSLTLWNDVLAKYDRLAIAWINRGEARAGRGDFNGALLDFEKALAIDLEQQHGLVQSRGGQHQKG